jgi:hypothetical protein
MLKRLGLQDGVECEVIDPSEGTGFILGEAGEKGSIRSLENVYDKSEAQEDGSDVQFPNTVATSLGLLPFLPIKAGRIYLEIFIPRYFDVLEGLEIIRDLLIRGRSLHGASA